MEESETRFEDEMTAKWLDWKKEQEAYAAVQKENEARLKKDREREKEEYEDILALARKERDKDNYEAKKEAKLQEAC